MKRIAFLLILFANTGLFAKNKITIAHQLFPDTAKAISYLTNIKVEAHHAKKEVAAGIKVGEVSLALVSEKKEKEIVFSFPKDGKIVAQGIDVAAEKGALEWSNAWQKGEEWKLMISIAGDSAENFTLYSAYVLLPGINKWKLIGTCKLIGWKRHLESASNFFTAGKKGPILTTFSAPWIQRSNGSWKNLNNGTEPAPTVNLLSHADSLQQLLLETSTIQKAIISGQTDAKNENEGIFFTIMNGGQGPAVTITDTVVVHYKGYLFSNGAVFDQTKEKPASFPLVRLIKGWQLGLPLCKTGGKIKLVIPSAHGYSIRTRSPKIPPNSTLVFEIEVLETKALKKQ